jgi:hypothetical protein
MRKLMKDGIRLRFKLGYLNTIPTSLRVVSIEYEVNEQKHLQFLTDV